MKKNPFDMTKFNIAAGKMMEHLQRYKAVENPPFATILRGDIYETAKDLVFAFEHAIRVADGDAEECEWQRYLVEKNLDFDGGEDDDAENIAPSRPPVKSEMPCNCKHEDTAQEKTLDEIVKESAEKVRGTNCIAVIIADEETWAKKG